MKTVKLLIALALAVSSYAGNGPRLYIAPMQGNLDGFIAAEIIKQHVQFQVVTDEKSADLILTGASLRADDRWYNIVFHGKDKNEGNVRLLDVKTKTMIWAGEAGDRSLIYGAYKRGGQRKVSERLVRQMKRGCFQSGIQLPASGISSGYHLESEKK